MPRLYRALSYQPSALDFLAEAENRRRVLVNGNASAHEPGLKAQGAVRGRSSLF